MTEPEVEYATARMTEAEVQREAVERLRAHEWVCVITASDKRKRKQEKGFPDVVGFRRGVTALLEMKAEGGGWKDLEDSQVAFFEKVQPHLGKHLIYRIVAHPDAVDDLCEDGEEAQ